MKNLFTTGLILLSTTLGLSACGSNVTPVGLESNSFISAEDSSFTTTAQNGTKQGKGKKGGFKGDKGKGGFNQFPGIELTAEQKTALETLRPQVVQKDQATVKADMEALSKTIKEAFLAETINAADLKAKLTALRPAQPDFAAHAANMVKAYNVLTAEQKATLETNKKEMQAKIDAKIAANLSTTAKTRPDNTAMFDKLTADLGLSDAQKTSLKEALTRPAQVEADRTAAEAERKTKHEAVDAAIKAGDVSRLTELLSSQKRPDHLDNSVDRLVKIHDILTADQRIKAVDRIAFLSIGGGHGRPHGGDFGSHEGMGPQGGHGDFGGHKGMRPKNGDAN